MAVKKDVMNIEKKEVIDVFYKTFKEKKKDVYKKIAEMIETSRRRMISVNLSKIQKLKNVLDDSIVVIPGKVLSVGTLEKNVLVYAYSFSKSAKDKLKEKLKPITDFTKDKIDFKKVVIVK